MALYRVHVEQVVTYEFELDRPTSFEARQDAEEEVRLGDIRPANVQIRTAKTRAEFVMGGSL